jgi:hypothetical protein
MEGWILCGCLVGRCYVIAYWHYETMTLLVLSSKGVQPNVTLPLTAFHVEGQAKFLIFAAVVAVSF